MSQTITLTQDNVSEFTDAIIASSKKGPVKDVTLDYSPQSLSDLDKIITEFSKIGLPETQIHPALNMFGLYLGEVIIRNIGGRWTDAEEETAPLLLVFENIGDQDVQDIYLNPIGKIFQFFKDNNKDPIPHFFELALKAYRGRLTLSEDP